MFDEFGNPDLEHEPTRINKLIRKTLRSFGKVAYVGYTATPFANIFIHDRGVTRELGADLFPRSFIVHNLNFPYPHRRHAAVHRTVPAQVIVPRLFSPAADDGTHRLIFRHGDDLSPAAPLTDRAALAAGHISHTVLDYTKLGHP